MIQQYVLLREENDLLNSLIGQSFNQKSKFEAGRILDEIHSKAESRMIGKKSLCYIVDKNEILGVGGSTLMKEKNGKIISNLILDQWGILMSGLWKRQSGTQNVVIMKDGSGVNRNIGVFHNSTPFTELSPLSLGIQLQVGSGSTPPARTDFNLETLFGTAPESTAFVPITNAVYNSGLGNFKQNGAIIAGGAGTINESICTGLYKDTGAIARGFALFRDIISPAQSFISSQTIALEYTIQL